MEELKNFENIELPDERQKFFAVLDSTSGQDRPLSLHDIYQNASDIKLHENVPEIIRSHFATAQNLLVYSWFFYPFNVTAELLAYITVEFALKERFKPTEKQSFKSLVKLAIKHGLVKDEGFSHINVRPGLDENTEQKVNSASLETKSYSEILTENIPSLRNELAHGSRTLHPNGVTTVRICSEFINQLFPEKES